MTTVNADERRIEIRADEGAPAAVIVAENAEIFAGSSDARDSKNARRIRLSDIASGDRILARGSPAGTVLVMSRQEIERTRAAERADWERRGVSGVIAATDRTARTVSAGVEPLLEAAPQHAGQAWNPDLNMNVGW